MSYLSNVAKSFGRAAPVIAKKEFEGAFSLIETLTGSNATEIASIFKSTGSFVGTELGSTLTGALSKIKEQVKTGEFYQSEEQNSDDMASALGMDMEGMFSDEDMMGDTESDSDSESMEDVDSPSLSDSMRAKATDNSMAAGEMTSNAVILSASATSNAIFSASNVTRSSIGKMAQANYQMQSATLKQLNGESQASAVFRERIFGLIADTKESLDSMIGLQEKAAAYNNHYDLPETPGLQVGDDIISDGRLSINKYILDLSEKITAPFEDGSAFKQMAVVLSQPFSTALEFGFSSMLENPKFQRISESLNLIGEIPTAFALKLNDWGDKFSDKWYGKLAKFFAPSDMKIDESVVSYHKGAMPYNGMANRAIIHVIPGLLSKILMESKKANGEKLASGSQTAYDYEKGKFTTLGDLQNQKNDEKGVAKLAMGQDFNRVMDNKTFRDKESKTHFENMLQDMFYNAGTSGKLFHQLKESDLGDTFNSPMHQDVLNSYKSMNAVQRADFNKRMFMVNENARSNRNTDGEKYSQLLQESDDTKKYLNRVNYNADGEAQIGVQDQRLLMADGKYNVGDTTGLGSPMPTNKIDTALYKYQNNIAKHLYGGEMGELDPLNKKPSKLSEKWKSFKERVSANKEAGLYGNAGSMASMSASLGTFDFKGFKSELASTVTNTFDKMSGKVTDLVSSTFKNFQSKFMESVGNPLKSTFSDMKSDLSAVMIKTKDSLYANVFGTDADGKAITPTDWFATRFEPLKTALTEKLSSVWDNVSVIAKQKFADIKKSFLDITMGTPEKPGFVRSIFNSVTDGIINPIKDKVIAKFESMFGDKGEGSWSDRLYNSSKKAITKSLDFITSKTSEIFGKGSLKTFSDLKDKVMDYTSFYWEKTSKFLDTKVWQPLQSNLSVFTDKVSELSVKFADTSKEFFNEYVFGDGPNSFKSKVLQPTGQWLNEKVFSPFKEEVKSVWASATNFVQTSLVEPLKDTMSPFLQELKIQFKMLKKWGFDYAGQLTESVKDVFSKANDASGALFGNKIGDILEDKVLNPIKDTWSQFKNWFGTGIKNVTSKFTSFIKDSGDKLRVKHLTNNDGKDGGYISKKHVARLTALGKVTLTDEQKLNWKNNRQSYIGEEKANKELKDARNAEFEMHRKAKEKARGFALKERLAANKSKGKMSLMDKISQGLIDGGTKAADVTEKLKASLFSAKDIEGEKSKSAQASMVTANAVDKQSKTILSQLKESKKSTNYLGKILGVLSEKSLDVKNKANTASKKVSAEAKSLNNAVTSSVINVKNTASDKLKNVSLSSSINLDETIDKASAKLKSIAVDIKDKAQQLDTAAKKAINSNSQTKIKSDSDSTSSGGLESGAQTASNTNFIRISSERIRLDTKGIHSFLKDNLGNASTYLRKIAKHLVGENTSGLLASGTTKKRGILGRLFGGLFNTATSLLGTGMKAIGSLITAPFRLLNGALGGLGKAIGSTVHALATVTKGLSSMAAGFASAVGSVVKGLASGVGSILKHTGAMLTGVIGAVGTAANTMLKGVSAIVTTSFSLLSSLVTTVAPALLKGMGSLLGGMFKGIGHGISGIAKGVGSVVNLVRGKRPELDGIKKVFVVGGFLDGIRNSVGIHKRNPKLDKVIDSSPLGHKNFVDKATDVTKEKAKSVKETAEAALIVAKDPKLRQEFMDDIDAHLYKKKKQGKRKVDEIKETVNQTINKLNPFHKEKTRWEKVKEKTTDIKNAVNPFYKKPRTRLEKITDSLIAQKNKLNPLYKEPEKKKSILSQAKDAFTLRKEKKEEADKKSLFGWRKDSLNAQEESASHLGKITKGFGMFGKVISMLGAGVMSISKFLGASKLGKFALGAVGMFKGVLGKMLAPLGMGVAALLKGVGLGSLGDKLTSWLGGDKDEDTDKKSDKSDRQKNSEEATKPKKDKKPTKSELKAERKLKAKEEERLRERRKNPKTFKDKFANKTEAFRNKRKAKHNARLLKRGGKKSIASMAFGAAAGAARWFGGQAAEHSDEIIDYSKDKLSEHVPDKYKDAINDEIFDDASDKFSEKVSNTIDARRESKLARKQADGQSLTKKQKRKLAQQRAKQAKNVGKNATKNAGKSALDKFKEEALANGKKSAVKGLVKDKVSASLTLKGLAGNLLGVGKLAGKLALGKLAGNMASGDAKGTVDTLSSMAEYASYGSMIGSVVPVLGNGVGAVLGAAVGATVANWDSITKGIGGAFFGQQAKFDENGDLVQEQTANIAKKLYTGLFGKAAAYNENGDVVSYQSDNIFGKLMGAMVGTDAQFDPDGKLIQQGNDDIITKMGRIPEHLGLWWDQFSLDIGIGFNKTMDGFKKGIMGFGSTLKNGALGMVKSIGGFLTDWKKNFVNPKWYKEQWDNLKKGAKNIKDKVVGGISGAAHVVSNKVSSVWDGAMGSMGVGDKNSDSMQKDLMKPLVNEKYKKLMAKNEEKLNGMELADREAQRQIYWRKATQQAEKQYSSDGIEFRELGAMSGLSLEDIQKMDIRERGKLYWELKNGSKTQTEVLKEKATSIQKSLDTKSKAESTNGAKFAKMTENNRKSMGITAGVAPAAKWERNGALVKYNTDNNAAFATASDAVLQKTPNGLVYRPKTNAHKAVVDPDAAIGVNKDGTFKENWKVTAGSPNLYNYNKLATYSDNTPIWFTFNNKKFSVTDRNFMNPTNGQIDWKSVVPFGGNVPSQRIGVVFTPDQKMELNSSNVHSSNVATPVVEQSKAKLLHTPDDIVSSQPPKPSSIETRVKSAVQSKIDAISKFKADAIKSDKIPFKGVLGLSEPEEYEEEEEETVESMLPKSEWKVNPAKTSVELKSHASQIGVPPLLMRPTVNLFDTPKSNAGQFKFSTDLPHVIEHKPAKASTGIGKDGVPVMLANKNASAGEVATNELKVPTLSKELSNKDLSKYNPSQGENSLIKAMNSAGITNGTERKMFMTQMAHESMGYKRLIEMASGAAYEGRKDLGNTNPGDGVKYKGRGFIQLTGRDNYRIFGNKVGLDLVDNPQLAANPDVASAVAIAYWKDRVNRQAAMNGDVMTVTRNINGGTNGLQDRIRRFNDPKNNKYSGSDYVAPYIDGGDVDLSSQNGSGGAAAPSKPFGDLSGASMNALTIAKMISQGDIKRPSAEESAAKKIADRGAYKKINESIMKKSGAKIQKISDTNVTNPKVTKEKDDINLSKKANAKFGNSDINGVIGYDKDGVPIVSQSSLNKATEVKNYDSRKQSNAKFSKLNSSGVIGYDKDGVPIVSQSSLNKATEVKMTTTTNRDNVGALDKPAAPNITVNSDAPKQVAAIDNQTQILAMISKGIEQLVQNSNIDPDMKKAIVAISQNPTKEQIGKTVKDVATSASKDVIDHGTTNINTNVFNGKQVIAGKDRELAKNYISDLMAKL